MKAHVRELKVLLDVVKNVHTLNNLHSKYCELDNRERKVFPKQLLLRSQFFSHHVKLLKALLENEHLSVVGHLKRFSICISQRFELNSVDQYTVLIIHVALLRGLVDTNN